MNHLKLELLSTLAHARLEQVTCKGAASRRPVTVMPGGRRHSNGAAAAQPLIDRFMPVPWPLAVFR